MVSNLHRANEEVGEKEGVGEREEVAEKEGEAEREEVAEREGVVDLVGLGNGLL